MTRSVLQPLRSRRISSLPPSPRSDPDAKTSRLTPATRQTLAAIGALWVSFAVSASASAAPTGSGPSIA